MAQFLNMLRAEERVGGVEFWHTPERAGWLIPRGVIEVSKCLSIKGAEDVVRRPHAFELSTTEDVMFFLADSDKEKEDWINAVGRAIVRHSSTMVNEDGSY